MNFKKPSMEKKPKIEKFYNKSDLLTYENMQRFSAFGQMYSSSKKTQPKISFGKATRSKNEKIYQSKALSKTQFLGKQGPGPKYQPDYKPLLKKLPKWSFGTSKRNNIKKNKGKYDFYELEDIRLDISTSKASTYKKSKDFKFTSSKRFLGETKKENEIPGPIYNIPGCVKKKIGNTFGFRRGGKKSKLSKNLGTSQNVGPDSYNPKYKFLSQKVKKPIFSFGKSKRKFGMKKNIKNETYEKYNSFGKQNMTKKKTENRVKFGKGVRGSSAGVFRGDMTRTMTRLRLPHAHY